MVPPMSPWALASRRVLLHGVGIRLEAWGPQLAALAETHRVIAAQIRSGPFDCDALLRRWFGDDDSPARRATAE